ncbi:MAG: transcriptional repressor [Desulfovermiculus sp.]|nr:transcriptional repressor [Desulfovermiculus sp.]
MNTSKALRVTPQRRVILEELRKVDTHPTADELYEMVRKRLPKVSLGTIYRNLDLLSSEGIIQKLQVGNSQMRFDGNPESHMHITCLQCRRVADVFHGPDTSGVCREVQTDFTVLGCTVLLYGMCPECAAEVDSSAPLASIGEQGGTSS